MKAVKIILIIILILYVLAVLAIHSGLGIGDGTPPNWIQALTFGKFGTPESKTALSASDNLPKQPIPTIN